MPHVADVRGRGLLAGVELTGNDAERFAQAALDAGLVVWPNVNIVMLAPPFIITEEEIDELVARFRTALCRLQ